MTSALAPTQGKPCRRTVGLPSVIDLVSISLLLARIPRQPEPCAPRGRGPERQDRGSPRLLGPARPAEAAGPCAKRAGDAGGVTSFRTVRCLRLLVHYVGCREVCTPRGTCGDPARADRLGPQESRGRTGRGLSLGHAILARKMQNVYSWVRDPVGLWHQ